MKAAAFELVRPATVEEAVAALARGGRVLAGGQSLVPLLAARSIEAAVLVDISGIAALHEITVTPGHVALGAMVTQRRTEGVETVHELARNRKRKANA